MIAAAIAQKNAQSNPGANYLDAILRKRAPLMSKVQRVKHLVHLALEVKKKTGKSVLAQFLEMAMLRFAPGQVGSSEYYDFHLWNDARFTWAQKRDFVGVKGQSVIEEIVIDAKSEILSLDKITFYTLMAGYGFPIPAIRAVYDPHGRFFPRAPVLRTTDAVAGLLRGNIEYPFFLKPSNGSYGRGNAHVVGMDSSADALILAGNQRRPVDAFVRALPNRGQLGLMFQEVLHPHADIRERCGDRICGVRLQVLRTRRGPRLFLSMWKVATAANPFDNFHKGKEGNMLAAVNPDSGAIERVIGGLVPRQTEQSIHPDTGRELLGFTLPGWRQVVDTVLAASTVFPGFPAQGWDVAICDSGPILLECNMLGDVDLSQFAWQKGFLDEDFRAFLDQHGGRHLLRGGARLSQVNPNTRRGRRTAHWPY